MADDKISTNVNDNNDVWLEKLDTIANNAFEVKSAILSGLHGANLDLTDKLCYTLKAIEN